MVSQKPKYCKNFERNSHWRKLFMIMVWERYCNASPKPELFLFSLFIFSFISQLIWVCLGWNFHRWFSIQKQINWCTIDPFSLKFCTSQHSYPVPLKLLGVGWIKICMSGTFVELTGKKIKRKSHVSITSIHFVDQATGFYLHYVYMHPASRHLHTRVPLWNMHTHM